MPARNGQQLLEALNAQRRDVYIGGEHITGKVAEHPAFQGITRSLAELYDMQHAPALRDEMTYVSPSSGERVGMSFLIPRTQADLEKRRRAIYRWASHVGGMLGRTGDYLNSAVMAMAAAADFFGQVDPRYAGNIRKYYEFIRENDLLLTHTLINPQTNRAVGVAKQADPFLAARIVKETDAGVVIRGARMLATLGPISDEIMVFPSTLLRQVAEDEPYAFAFAVSNDTPGLRYICRETFDYGRSHFDHPLGSRFEEMDCVVIFDDVLVPWERVFMLRHVETCNQLYSATGAVTHMAHQVVTKNVAKTEFVLGVVLMLIDAIGIEPFQHVHEKALEVMTALETLKAFLRTSEVDAAPDAYGTMTPAFAPLNTARNWYPRTYPRFVEIIQQLGASGLMALPGEADFAGGAGPDIQRYLQAARADARSRVKLFRLAWDVAVSAFGSRQALYERFFFGDPVRMAGAYFNWYDKKPAMDRVREFLNRG